MTTGGAPIKVRFTRTTSFFPGNFVCYSTSPRKIPSMDAIKVDQKDITSVTRIESITPTVPKNFENRFPIFFLPAYPLKHLMFCRRSHFLNS